MADFQAVSTDILHFRARVLGVYGQGLFMAASDPGDRFGRALERPMVRFSRPSPPRRTGPRGPVCEKHYLHRLRKTCATFWHEKHIPIRTIQYWLGHKSLETTQKYLGIKDSAELQEQINAPKY